MWEINTYTAVFPSQHMMYVYGASIFVVVLPFEGPEFQDTHTELESKSDGVSIYARIVFQCVTDGCFFFFRIHIIRVIILRLKLHPGNIDRSCHIDLNGRVVHFSAGISEQSVYDGYMNLQHNMKTAPGNLKERHEIINIYRKRKII